MSNAPKVDGQSYAACWIVAGDYIELFGHIYLVEGRSIFGRDITLHLTDPRFGNESDYPIDGAELVKFAYNLRGE